MGVYGIQLSTDRFRGGLWGRKETSSCITLSDHMNNNQLSTRNALYAPTCVTERARSRAKPVTALLDNIAKVKCRADCSTHSADECHGSQQLAVNR